MKKIEAYRDTAATIIPQAPIITEQLLTIIQILIHTMVDITLTDLLTVIITTTEAITTLLMEISMQPQTRS